MRYGCGRSREGAGAVASACGERSGSTHKVAEVQCSRNTTPDPGNRMLRAKPACAHSGLRSMPLTRRYERSISDKKRDLFSKKRKSVYV